MKLAEIRKEQGLSQSALAALAGGVVTRGAIGYIETGETVRPRFDTVTRICEALNVEPQEVDEFAPMVEEFETATVTK